MNKNLTDITMVIDRSGSMQSIKDEATNGINAFIEDQKKESGDALLTLVQFDTEYDFVCNGVPLNDVSPYVLVPRGMTALLDAVGRSINEAGLRLSKMNEGDRPGLVVFVIVTDGHENSSHEFTKSQIKDMISLQQETYNWKFIFLGANQDSFTEAHQGMGIAAAHVCDFKDIAVSAGMDVVSSKLRSARVATAGGQSASFSFTSDERKSLK